MYIKAVLYKGDWLAPGSHAMELYQAKKFKELDTHMREVTARAQKLAGE